LLNVGEFDQPPGDNYHHWGFQDETAIPEKDRKKIEEAAMRCPGTEVKVGKYILLPWK